MANAPTRPLMPPPPPPVMARNNNQASLVPVNARAQTPYMAGPSRPPMVLGQHGRPLPPPPPPVPGGFNRPQQFNPNLQQQRPMMNPQQRAFGPTRPFGPNGFANQNFNSSQSQQFVGNEQINDEGPYYSNYDFVQSSSLEYSDNNYIKDLKTLEEFYEQNKYGPILEKRYLDYEIGWKPPKITLPLEELYARLKYYDDILRNESLDQNQIIEVKNNIKLLVDQITKYDDFEYYKKFGHERLFYNDDHADDMFDNSFRNVKWYQREGDLESWGTENIYAVPISLPKSSWWMSQDYSFPDEESSFVKIIKGENYPNELLLHPMFSYINEYGAFQDLSQEKILCPYPDNDINTSSSETKYENEPNYFYPLDQQPNENDDSSGKKKKKHWWDCFKKKKGEEQTMSQIEKKDFPKKENPPPPQPTKMPTKHNPPPPQPTKMPPRNNPQTPPTPGKGFGPNNGQMNTIANQSNGGYFNYQNQR